MLTEEVLGHVNRDGGLSISYWSGNLNLVIQQMKLYDDARSKGIDVKEECRSVDFFAAEVSKLNNLVGRLGGKK